ncbi:MAG TPA: hypothetical protein VHZ81_14570 [Galbitalea sp.]|nr:hypothetical protein [Galbitalea sp.]
MKRASVVAAVLGVLCLLLAGCSDPAPPDPAGITAAQRKAATESDLAYRWAGIQPADPVFLRPRVKIVKYVNYLDEGQVLIACMHSAGYRHVTWSLDGGVVDSDVKPVDRFPVEVSIFICESEYPSDPLELGYLSDAQEEYLYTYWGDESVPCLRSHGVSVPDLPPVGEFGEGYEDVGSLNPFNHLPASEVTNEAYLTTVCPPYPGEVYAAHK